MASARYTAGLLLATWVALAGHVPAAAAPPERAAPRTIEFNRDVRPILADNCFRCHGPDKNKREAELRLDTREGLFGNGTTGPIVAPRELGQSELWRRLQSADEDEHMPPRGSGKVLSPRDQELLKRWIEQGAPWEGHWAFNPLRRAAPPPSAPAQHPIDAFLFAAQDANLPVQPAQLEVAAPADRRTVFNAPADRRTVIRRLSWDLLGLPPRPEEVAHFLADDEPQAYQRLVDRLLASPHFGERLAVWWLDLVRYADSVGYHGDQPVSVFPFRDYVIRSFNDNKPFDVFTREQLAGDLLPGAALEQRIASGYNRLGMMSAEGGVQPREYLAKYIAERVRNASGTWLGTTLGCAECHDHKYDPLSTRDFYRFEAFFADIDERGLYSGANVDNNWGPRVAVPTPDQAQQLAALDEQIRAARATLDTDTPALAAAQARWEQQRPAWTVLRPATATSAGGATLTVLEDGSVLASGVNPDTDSYSLVMPDAPVGITAFRIEVLPHESLPHQGPGRADNGNFVLSELTATVQTTGGGAPHAVAFAQARASYEQTTLAENNPHGRWTIAAAIDGDAQGPTWGWAILGQIGKPQHAVLETAGELPGGAGATLTVRVMQNLNQPRHNLGRFRLAVTTAPRPVALQAPLPDAIEAVVATPVEQRSEAARQALAAYFRTIALALLPTRSRLSKLEAARTNLEQQIPTTLVTSAVAPRSIRVLRRGNWMDDGGEEVLPGVPAVLPQPAHTDRRLTRLDLAEWLVAPDNPLTARVFVNRVWKLCFGVGLSRRLDDLGAQGEWPSHPELLDWLAAQFIDSGWNVKQLVRLIVTSEAYQQSSQVSAQVAELDPENRWLTRQNRFRVESEFVRDAALRAGDLLVEQIGGASVKPYQPAGYWAYLNFPAREWQNATGDALYRRGVYTHWQRQYLHPSLAAFDAPSREECTADRPRSNTPLQALALLNDPTYVEAARALAELLLRQAVDDGSRLDLAYLRVLSRPLRDTERAVLLDLVQRHRDQYRRDPGAAVALIQIGARPVPSDIDTAELAAWTSVARALLNLHETITRN